MKLPPPSLFLRLFRRVDTRIQRARAELLRRQFSRCGRDVSLQWPVVINGADHLEVGDRVSINAFVHIWAQGGVRIGDDSLVASHVAITSLTHALTGGKYSATCLYRPVSIGRNVWIGTHAVILPGVTIGDDAVVGAGAVVTRDVEPGAVVVGIPARPQAKPPQ